MKIPFKNSILSWMVKKLMHQIDLFLKYPFLVQNELLFVLLEKAKNTIFGKEYDFSSIKSYADFRKSVPVKTYEEFFPYIQKLRKGEEDILKKKKIKWFAKSSGTTNAKSKFIPISKEALEDCHYKAGKDMLAIYCNNHHDTTIFNGKGLMLGGSQDINPLKKYVDGDLSAILLDNFPFWVNIHRIPDLKTALLAEVPNRRFSGDIEVSLKKHVADVTNWRKMLSGKPQEVDLVKMKEELSIHVPEELKQYILPDNTVTEINYPVREYPKKINSTKLDRTPIIKGELKGIKGQYLIFDANRVFNIRSHEGYISKVSYSETTHGRLF